MASNFILLVDDDEFSRNLYSDILKEGGYKVKTAENGEKALELLRLSDYDILLTDYVMPGMNGIELAKTVRGKYPTIDSVIMTAHGTMESAIEAMKHGIQDYLLKPVNPEELKLTVSRIINLRKVVEENTELKSNNELMRVLNRLSLCLEPDQLTETSVNLLSGYMKCDATASLTFQGRKKSFMLNFHSGLKKSETDVFAKTITKLYSGWKGRFKTVKLVKSPFLKMNLKKISQSFSSIIIIPLYLRKNLQGTIILVKRKRSKPFTQKSLKASKIISAHISSTLENCSRFVKAKELAFIDELTGLYNTRYLDYFVEKEIKRAKRQNYPLSFLFMDVDRFKQVNDVHGHLVGSRILIEVGKLIKQFVRDIDIIIRYGGDEYIIILINTAPDGAQLVGDRLRQAIEKHEFMKESNLKIRITASFGIATFPEHASNKDDIVNLADKAMYMAKKTTRNAVYIASDFLT